MSDSSISKLGHLTTQIASELVFVEVGKDNGLLPINSLLSEMEEWAASSPFASALQPRFTIARECVDRVFETTGAFSSESITILQTWIGSIQEAVETLERGETLAPLGNLVSPGTKALPATEPCKSNARAIQLDLNRDADLLREFLQESADHLQNIEQGVLALEENPNNLDVLNSIFRAFHTFKGGAGFLNLAPVQEIAHDLESLLDRARQGQLILTKPVIEVILEGGDHLRRFCDAISSQLTSRDSSSAIEIPTEDIRSRIKLILSGNAGQSHASLGLKAETEQKAPEPQSVLPSLSAVKVDTQKLDGLIDAVGEMVVAQSLVVQSPKLRSIQDEQLTRNLAELARITKDLQRIAMSLRMVPIRATFQKMHRLVRDAAVKLNKKIELDISGEETELDRTIIEEIGDPLIHMIRNAVDHGIEPTEVRAASQKPEQGTIRLSAYHQGGNIVIEIADDGKGLDKTALVAKAREKGLVGASEHLDENEIFGLIFAPGFSTAEKVTELSGRGVGMDVVRRNIEKLRGKIEIESQLGKGATFRIYLPLTLAIIDGFLVGVGDNRYILPTLTVSESFRPSPGAVKTVQGRGEVIDVRGQLRPLIRLADHLGLDSIAKDPSESVIVVVESSNKTRCILVDRLLGKQEVVIKSLGDTFHGNRCVSGAAILGDGRVGLILDSQALVQLDGSYARGSASLHSPSLN